MPMLRWLGFSRVTSLPPIDDGACRRLLEAGDHPQHRRLAAAGRAEEGDELAACRRRGRNPGRRSSAPKALRRFWMLRKGVCHASRFLVQFGRFAGFRREARKDLDHRHAPPGDGEGDDGERRRLVGAVGADVLQVGAEGRPVEQARHGELADHDGEGQEGAGQHGDQHIGQDDAGDDGRPAGAEDLRRFRQRAHVDRSQAGVDRAVHVGQRQRRIADDEQEVGAARGRQERQRRGRAVHADVAEHDHDRRNDQRQQRDELDDRPQLRHAQPDPVCGRHHDQHAQQDREDRDHDRIEEGLPGNGSPSTTR